MSHGVAGAANAGSCSCICAYCVTLSFSNTACEPNSGLLLHCFMGTLSTNSNLQQQASMCAWTEWDMPFDQLFMGESLIWFVPGRHQKHCMCSACGLLEDWQEEPHAQLTQITSNLSTAHATSADM